MDHPNTAPPLAACPQRTTSTWAPLDASIIIEVPTGFYPASTTAALIKFTLIFTGDLACALFTADLTAGAAAKL